MENKKLGIIFIVMSIIFLGFMFYFNSALLQQSNELGCAPQSSECVQVNESISITNIAFGFFGFMFALGFYLLFFNKTEQAILKKLEDEKNNKIKEEKFDIILKALDSYERKVMKAVNEDEGITQSTLKYRTNMSKAKLSYVLQELEKRKLIKRTPKGKTFQIFLKI